MDLQRASRSYCRPFGRGVNSQPSVQYKDETGTEWMLRPTSRLPPPEDANGVQAKPVIVVKTDVFQVGGPTDV